MKIIILDPYKKVNYRICKDTNGGFGTANNFGTSLVPSILKYLLKKKKRLSSFIRCLYFYNFTSKRSQNLLFKRIT